MSGLVFACIAPHGSEVIEELAGEAASRFETTRRAMEEIGRRMEEAQPETVVVITPHGVRVAGSVCIMTTERGMGVLEGSGGRVKIDIEMDAEFGRQIAEHAHRVYNVPIATAIYGASSGPGCYTPLDWGAVVPLWFLGARWDTPPTVVSITPSRELSLRQLYDFGTGLAEVSYETERRVAIVASADWGHAHSEDGPYGYNPASAEFDAMVVDAVHAGSLESLVETDIGFAERAKVDGLWQTVILAGALQHTPMRGELLSFEVPSYFGMLVASFEPDGSRQMADDEERSGSRETGTLYTTAPLSGSNQ